ncbi:hypothetical protein [Cohnella sp. AR92]|uniref:hypothetical protein n=1 Tax=Cohnella sp. AR92 TaxID=648716 RepID=UPI000F8F3306|nr:hypothetical protein [Cohnella sp. AR92]RUS42252.1 hypothetical protein ELR57_26935 [Cohnella sp. AR92]
MFDDIVEVVQTSSDFEANGFLKQGWKLLSVVPYRNEEISCPMFVLGRPSSSRRTKLNEEFSSLGS